MSAPSPRDGFRLLVFQHVAAEDLGRFAQLFEQDGADITTIALDQGASIPDLAGFDGIWALGGPMQIWEEETYPWLVDEKAAIREAVTDRNMPYFGLCLGHQLLADALGGTVGPSGQPEVGVLPVELTRDGQNSAIFAGLEPVLHCTQGHGAEVITPPDGARILARSAACKVQALGIEDRVFSLQFHSELTLDMVDACLKIPAYKADFEAMLGDAGIRAFRRDIRTRAEEHDRIARQLYDNWITAALTPPP